MVGCGWVLTNACNLKCVHCDVEAGASSPKELRVEECFGVADDLAEMGLSFFIFSGGEPLLFKGFFDLASYAAGRGLHPAIATNGTLITEAVARKLGEVGIESVSIGIDGACAETHDAFRGAPHSFERSIAAVKACVKEGMKTHLGLTVTKRNFGEVERVAELAVGLGASTVSFRKFNPVGRGKDDLANLQLDTAQYKALLDRIVELRKKLGDAVKVHRHDPLWVLHGGAPHAMGCEAGRGWFTITAEGDVWPCSQLPISVGNVRERSIKEIWRDSPVLKGLRERAGLKGKCGRCPHKSRCGGCRSAALGCSGDYLAEDPYCWLP